MRKLILLYCLCLIVATASSQDIVDAQHRVSGGPKAEINFSKYSIIPTPMNYGRIDAGLSLGGFLHINVYKQFAIQGELLIHYKNSYIRKSNDLLRSWGLDIPIYLMYAPTLKGGDRLYIGVGPYCEFGLLATTWIKGEKINLYQIDNRHELQAMNGSHTGFGAMIGYEFLFGLQINFSYKISMTNLLDSNSNNIALYPMTASVGLAYRFVKE